MNRQDIFRLSRQEPTIRACLEAWECADLKSSEVMSWEGALCQMIIYLESDINNLLNQIRSHSQNSDVYSSTEQAVNLLSHTRPPCVNEGNLQPRITADQEVELLEAIATRLSMKQALSAHLMFIFEHRPFHLMSRSTVANYLAKARRIACKGCKDYCGKHNVICGIHPHGWKDPSQECPDKRIDLPVSWGIQSTRSVQVPRLAELILQEQGIQRQQSEVREAMEQRRLTDIEREIQLVSLEEKKLQMRLENVRRAIQEETLLGRGNGQRVQSLLVEEANLITDLSNFA